ncbi:hypothetical protein [Aquabacterium sp.]|uniref:hypothetical protein n=1 Tax=Aquabacterium sp. TaxID=1872578 RepID=UPI0019ADD32B|nr:hypothetical protein [Aquabacterium sp.]MBC7699476.1 hypothetical protein [Aquabacterium sp.]
MNALRQTPTAPLAHLTAVHLLGRILERLDHCPNGPSQPARYQAAMQRLSKALDRVEQTFVVRLVLEANPAPALGQEHPAPR